MSESTAVGTGGGDVLGRRATAAGGNPREES